MDRIPRPERYSPLEQAFHWVTAVAVLVAFLYGPGGPEERVYSAARDFDRQLHETLGLAVFVLTALRLAWRFFDVRPEEPPMAAWMGAGAKIVRVLLYVLLFALPITAVTGAWLEGHPMTLLAGLKVGPFLAESHGLGATFARVHKWLGDAIMWLAGLHAAAALYHHFVLGDRVLRSMLPVTRSTGRTPRG